MFLALQILNLYQNKYNGIPVGFVRIHWVIWIPTTILVVASYFGRIRLIYFAWLGIYLRGIIWLFQIENIIEKYSGDPDMYREKFTDTFIACYFLYFCVQIFENLANKYSLYVYLFNIFILLFGIQSRCYGLRNLIKVNSEEGIANGIPILITSILINMINFYLLGSFRNVEFKEFREVGKVITMLSVKDQAS